MATTINRKVFSDYLHSVERTLRAGYASEGSHYPSIKNLLESLRPGITATCLPSRIECGAPDFIVTEDSVPIGYLEAKDIGKSLDEIELGKGPDGERFSRYLGSLSNLILTDYLEFRWYVDGERRISERLGMPTKEGKIRRDKAGIQPVAELLAGFLSRKAEEDVGTPKELARRMARLAHMIRDLIINAFKKEPEGGSLHNQLVAFCDNLIPDLSVEQFADMYAQTIAYGLFAARCTNSAGKEFTRQNAAYLLPKTNPFLRKLFNHIAGPDLDDRIAWLVDDLAHLFAQANMEAILKNFGKRTAREDPVVHFYETFLKDYDPGIKEMRGVYYTPEPVVSYIVRSIDHLLKTRFDKPLGLADDKTLMLDPAVGTATFLYMVISEIHQTMVSQGQQGLWNGYVGKNLLPRIFGFELLIAPYAVAHLKLGLLLQETGYQFQTDQRLCIYLTNTLEEALKKSELLLGRYIVEEGEAAAHIKKNLPIMVVLGNPPYSGISANASLKKENVKAGTRYKKRIGGKWEWVTAKRPLTARVPTFIGELLDDYYQVDGKPLGEKNPKWLQDDYVKFIRFGQWRIDRTGQGVLGFITNHAYLDNPTFRGMRQSLMKSFSNIYILNLHGSTRRREIAPDDGKDENVFDIQQGVTIALFVKRKGISMPAKVYYADLWGTRGNWPHPQPGTKYHTLAETDISTTAWSELKPKSPSYLFVRQQGNLLAEYDNGWKVTAIFPVNSVGIVTARDKLTIRWSKEEVAATIKDFASLTPEEARERYELGEDARDWKVTLAQEEVKTTGINTDLVVPILYRPFDVRHTYYTGHSRGFHCMPRGEVMRHMLVRDNPGLVCCRQQSQSEHWSLIGAANSIIESSYISNKTREINYLFPLYLYLTEGEMRFEGERRRPNLGPAFIKTVQDKLGLKFVEDGQGDLEQTFGPEDIFNYAYAVFHSPTYRSRYAEFLKRDFPRLPLTSDKWLFKALVEKGAELVALHLMKAPVLEQQRAQIKFDVSGSNIVERVTYNGTINRAYINKEQYFEGVSPEVWGFHIGGYQVCQKWLKDRKGRTLTYDELVHYQKIIVALKETIRLMSEIEMVIPRWPLT